MYLHPMLSNISQEDRLALVRETEIRSYRRNEVVLQADDWTDRIYCVGSGLLRTVVSGGDERDQVTTDFIRQDDFFLSPTLSQEKYQPGVMLVAALPSSVFLVPAAMLYRLCHKYPAITLELLELMTRRAALLRGQLRRIASSSSEKVVTRVLHELTQLAPAGTHGYDKRITQSIIASYSGLSREQVNKTIRNLESRGLIRKQDDGIEVPPSFQYTDFQELMPHPAAHHQ